MHKLFTFMIRQDESCHLVCQWTMCASSSLFISLLFKMLKVTWFRTDWTVCWVGSVRCRPDTNVIDIMRASLFSFLQCKNTVQQSPWSMANGCVSILRVSYTIMPPKDDAKAYKLKWKILSFDWGLTLLLTLSKSHSARHKFLTNKYENWVRKFIKEFLPSHPSHA